LFHADREGLRVAGRKRRRNGSGRGAVSAQTVAEHAGVSQAAVSRAYTPGASISPELRERVIRAAEELGYQPNAIARGLITSRTGIVGLVGGDFVNPFYSLVIEELSVQLQRIGLHPLLFVIPKEERVDGVLPQILQYQVDAIVIAAATMSSAMAWECLRRGTPVVLFNRNVPDTPTHVIGTDNFGGGRTVGYLLARSGHQRLGYIAGHADTSTSRDRERGFLAALDELGVGDVEKADGQYSYAGARQAADVMLRRRRRPEAIFCANDLMAFGVLDAARDLGIAVPSELSVIGFDDVPQAAWGAYELTTFRAPVAAMAQATVELLGKLRQASSPPRVSYTLPAEFVSRRSARLTADALASAGVVAPGAVRTGTRQQGSRRS
jgi:DNA-binding LacI/PurR family transcriptional regulator